MQPSPKVSAENIDTEGKEFTYTWNTLVRKHIPRKVSVWNSPTFSASPNDPKTWYLIIASGKDQNVGSIYLKLISCDVPEIRVNFELFVVHPPTERRVLIEEYKEHVFVAGGSNGYTFRKYEWLNNPERGFIYDDKLTVGCKVLILPLNTKTEQFKLPNCKLSEDFGNLFENEMFSDVSLAVDGHEIKAHKAILAARSTVFAAMFKHEMEERKLNHVVIADIDYEVLKEMLCFIYTGKAPNIYKMADQLLAAADKYALEKLKVMCEEEEFDSISIETAVETLSFSDLHNAHQLKRQTIDFINSNVTKVMETQGWRNLFYTHSHLCAEVFKSVCNTINQIANKRQKNG